MVREAEPIDLRALRQALGCFVTGVTIVTTIDAEGNPRGFTANSFTSVSLDPPLILVCIGKTAGSYEVFQSCDAFAVNILSEAQQEVSGVFASKIADRFERVAWHAESTGAPLLDGGLAWLECRAEERIASGDHLILVGRVMNFQSGSDRPLGYFRGGYVNFGLNQRALASLQGPRLVLGCIAQKDGRVMLCRRRPNGLWDLPTSALALSDAPPKKALRALLSRLGASVQFSFLYSVYELSEPETEHVVFRASFTEPWRDVVLEDLEARLFAPADIPWSQMETREVSSMLKRYLRERATARFGIYFDSPGGGQIAALEGQPENCSDAPISTGVKEAQ